MKFGEICINWTNSYKYLGVEVTNNGCTTAMSLNLSNRAWKAVFKIKSIFKDTNVSPQLQLKMLQIQVRPILCYSSEVWGLFTYISDNKVNLHDISAFWKKIEKLSVESFHIKFLKSLLGVHSRSSNAAVMGEVGKYPMFNYIIKCVLGYFSHLNKSAPHRPILAAAMYEDRMLPKNVAWYKRTDGLLNMFGYELSDFNNELTKKDFFCKN